MANVLAELFSDIAESIREGLGYQGTMKPSAFPSKIDEIVALLNEEIVSRPPMSGVETGSDLKIARGYIKPESDRTRVTVEHGLGVMPDLVVVYQAGNPIADYDSVEEFVEAYPIISAWGMKSTFNTQIRSVMNLPGWGFTYAYGIDNVPAEERPAGFIYCPDEDTFQVGRQATDGAVGLAANLDYYWVAISGIGSGAAEPVVQALTVTENGTYIPPEGVDGYSPVTVAVEGAGGGGITIEQCAMGGITGSFYSEEITQIADYAFVGQRGITGLTLPNLTKVGQYGLYRCSGLEQLDVSKVTSVGTFAFASCSKLKKLDFGTSLNSQIGKSAFSTGGSELHVIIRNTKMIDDASSTTGYIFGSTSHYLYVPSALVNTWKNSNYMKGYHQACVRAIEDYPEICG